MYICTCVTNSYCKLIYARFILIMPAFTVYYTLCGITVSIHAVMVHNYYAYNICI